MLCCGNCSYGHIDFVLLAKKLLMKQESTYLFRYPICPLCTPFLPPENIRKPYAFRGYRNGELGTNGLCHAESIFVIASIVYLARGIGLNLFVDSMD